MTLRTSLTKILNIVISYGLMDLWEGKKEWKFYQVLILIISITKSYRYDYIL